LSRVSPLFLPNLDLEQCGSASSYTTPLATSAKLIENCS
jgi:hypothetical protein